MSQVYKAPFKKEFEVLILTRKTGESVKIGDDVTITITKLTSSRVRLGIEAPKDVLILREEIKKNPDVEEEVA